MTLTISVYEKHGLCRGPAILDAWFKQPPFFLAATGGGPLGGATYQVEPRFVSPNQRIYLVVGSPRHHPHDFFVNDGETHDVWLFRRDN
jgi:hypothetical protein